MPPTVGIRSNRWSGIGGSRRKRNQQGVSTPSAFPPRTLEPDQVRGAPDDTLPHQPFLPPRNGEKWKVASSQETPAWLHFLCLLSGA